MHEAHHRPRLQIVEWLKIVSTRTTTTLDFIRKLMTPNPLTSQMRSHSISCHRPPTLKLTNFGLPLSQINSLNYRPANDASTQPAGQERNIRKRAFRVFRAFRTFEWLAGWLAGEEIEFWDWLSVCREDFNKKRTRAHSLWQYLILLPIIIWSLIHFSTHTHTIHLLLKGTRTATHRPESVNKFDRIQFHPWLLLLAKAQRSSKRTELWSTTPPFFL